MTNVPQYLRMPDLTARLGLARSTIYARIKAGKFPAPTKLTRRASGWVEHEIVACLQAQQALAMAPTSEVSLEA